MAAPAPRVVVVSSFGHHLSPVRLRDPGFAAGAYDKWRAYGQSKTANILMAAHLARLARGRLLAFSLHPGVILDTHLGDHLDWEAEAARLSEMDRLAGYPPGWSTDLASRSVTADEGAATHVFAAFDPDIAPLNGAYFEDCRVADAWNDRVKPWATDPVEAERLWKLSERLVGQEFSY
ncbi:hypothetical protein CDD83_10516 [Cordyceps sp. RAO-2017]|nr:hypothetical protein CDD83_10516 [Cordyceps sp. RAO-2017]